MTDNELTTLVTLATRARRNYNREWRNRNKERVKAYNAAYWMKYVARLQVESATK